MLAALLAAAVGIGLMAAPSLLGYGGFAADVDRVIGPLAAMFGVVAASQVTRPLRWANAGLGVLLVVAAVALDQPTGAALLHAAAGVSLVVLARHPGKITDQFGGGWSALARRT